MIKFLSIAALATIGFTAHADTVINTFDTGPNNVPITTSGPLTFGDGTTIDALGVTFSFNIAEGATYGDTIGTVSNDLTQYGFADPVLDGMSSGVLTLDFDSPTTFFSFDILYAPDPTAQTGDCSTQTNCVTIGGTQLTFDTTNGLGAGGAFSVGSFNSGTLAPFTSATISFNSGATLFAIDNLSYDDPPGTPEPTSFTLFLGAALVVAGSRSARKSRIKNCR